MVQLKSESSEIIPIVVPAKGSLKTINFYLVRSGQSLILIDAGLNNQPCWEALLQTLKENDLTVEDLNAIILTHHHFDHVGLVNRIVEKHPIPVYSSPLSIPRLKRDRHFLEMRVQFFEKLYREAGCGPMGEKRVKELQNAIETNKDHAIQADITEITGLSFLQFKVIDVPGHAHDHIALQDEDRNWMFAGDVLIKHISSNALVEPDFKGNRLPTLVQQRDSLLKISELNPTTVFSGHGDVIENPQQIIGKRIERMDDKAMKILQLIQSGQTTPNDIAISYYQKTYEEQFHLVMSEIIGYLDYLEANQAVKKDFVHGTWQYSPQEKQMCAE